MSARVAVIGVGNTLMGDDGAGVVVAERVRERIGDREGVEVVTGHLAGPLLIAPVRRNDHVIFIDALAVDDEPGAVFRMDPDRAGITGLRSTTSHGMGIPYLITNARLLGHSPEFVVYGIQIGDVMGGPDTLSPHVAAAVERVTDLVLDDIERALTAENVAGSLLVGDGVADAHL